MKKLRVASCAILLMAAVGLIIGTHGSSSFLFVKELIAAEECVKCTDVGCTGGTLLCAQFLCKGTVVQCFTGGTPPTPPPPPPAVV